MRFSPFQLFSVFLAHIHTHRITPLAGARVAHTEDRLCRLPTGRWNDWMSRMNIGPNHYRPEKVLPTNTAFLGRKIC